MPENYDTWNLFITMLSGLIREDGYDYTAIQVVFDCYGIEQEARPELMERIKKMIDVVEAERIRRRTHAG